MLELITDRTPRDVVRLQELNAKGWSNMTDAEKAEWKQVSKGAYNYTDLNRVESAVEYLAKELKKVGYAVEIFPVRTWSVNEVPTLSDMTRYLENVRRIREAFVTLNTTSPTPESMIGLTHSGANTIEQILSDVEVLMGNMVSAFVNCGEIFGGEM